MSFPLSENSFGQSFGQVLRSLRQSRGWNLSETARRVGIGRVTLHRWESDAQTPRLLEAEALLTVLGVSVQEQRPALALIDAPRAQRRLRESLDLIGQTKRLGPLPNRGSLLRALRRRQDRSLPDVASALSVSARTLRSWENGDIWPVAEKLHLLCYTLGAHEHELIALTCHRAHRDTPGQSMDLFVDPSVSAGKTGSKGSLDADFAVIEARLEQLRHRFAFAFDPLIELDLFSLMEQAWWLAARHPGGRPILASVYAQYAHFLSERERFGEITPVAERSLALLGRDKVPTKGSWLYAVIASARDAVYRGGNLAPQRGIRLLRQWLPVTDVPEFQAWILTEMAKYQAMLSMLSPETGAGETLSLVDVVEQACATAQDVNPIEGAMRRRDKARLLLLLKRPDEALSYLDYRFYSSPPNRAETALLITEAHLERGAIGEALEWLQTSRRDIAACHDRVNLHRRAAELTHRLERS